MSSLANLKSTLVLLGRIIGRTYFPGKGSMARVSPRRFVIMTVFIPIFCLLQAIHWVGFILDDIFFRGYRQIKIKKPLFIIGIPRTGTTFLHKTLAQDVGQWTTLTLGELILAPSITERKFWQGMQNLDRSIGRPFSRLLGWIKPRSAGRMKPIHQITFNAPEEDFMTLIPILACFLLVHPFPFPEMWRLAYFDDRVPPRDKKRILTFYKACLQRHLYVNGSEKRLLAKNASFCPMIQALKDTFPDCKVIFTARNPLSSVPSFLSTMSEGARLFDNNIQGHQFRDRNLEILRYFHSHMLAALSEWPSSRYIIVTMEAIKQNVEDIVKGIYDRFDIPLKQPFTQYLAEVTPQAQRYTSQHRYSLAAFDLDPEDVFREFSDIFTRFGYEFKEE